MNIIYMLVIISVVLLAVIAVVFFWAVRSGQFDDLEKHSQQILMDNDKPAEDRKESKPQK